MELRKQHDWIPVFLPENKINEWIKTKTTAESIIRFAQADLIIEKNQTGNGQSN
ncbi:MAG: hypothetical protein IJI41_03120 [Anaerolineaceae bacterium]|nr:hypothetical protein [Anaerolineaceae bacterium]